MKNILSYSPFFLFLTFVTGLTGLCYQVIWQRSLTVLIGADSRSTSLVVALFLLGLAFGNFFFGFKSQKLTRNKALKIYGACEILIGIWAILYPKLLQLFQVFLDHFSQNILIDLLSSSFLILPPTFLMGATIPLLTGSLPSDQSEIHDYHQKIYGINTIGAFFGVLLGAFYIIPEFGLSFGSNLLGLLNLIIGTFFYLNTFQGDIQKVDNPPLIVHKWSNKTIYIFSFVTGTFTIGLEILLIRIWSLAMGPSLFVFPMVLSLFILGLGLGSLTIKQVNVETVSREMLKASFGLLWTMVTFCYLPYWVGHFRMLIALNNLGFYLYHFCLYLLMALVILPSVVPLGRLLPMGYSFLKKTKNDYSLVCGKLYTSNTLGTFFGSIFVGHLFFYFFKIDVIYKVSIFFFLFIVLYFLFVHKKRLMVFVVFTLLIFQITFPWNRRLHYFSLYRLEHYVKNLHNQGLFFIPDFKTLAIDPISLNDDIYNTVAVAGVGEEGVSVFVNGKNDSSTIGDLGTLTLSGVIPYLLLDKKTGINVASIGLGTGLSAGVLSQLSGVESIDVPEISPGMIQAQYDLVDYNYNVINQDKVKIFQSDAFRFFSDKQDKYDLILSEPTNPWVVGVENLFTRYFYQRIKKGLSKNGIFGQWFQIYDMSPDILLSVISNLRATFKNIWMFKTLDNDILFVASDSLDRIEFKENKFDDIKLQKILSNINIFNPHLIRLLLIMNPREINLLLSVNLAKEHSIEFPTLSLRSYFSFYNHDLVNTHNLIDPYLKSRIIDNYNPQNLSLITDFKNKKENIENCKKVKLNTDPFCSIISSDLAAFDQYNSKNNPLLNLKGRRILIQKGYIPNDSNFYLNIQRKCLLSNNVKCLLSLFDEISKDGLNHQFLSLKEKLIELDQGRIVAIIEAKKNNVDLIIRNLNKSK